MILLLFICLAVLLWLWVVGKLYDIHDDVALTQYRLGKLYDHTFPEENGRQRCP